MMNFMMRFNNSKSNKILISIINITWSEGENNCNSYEDTTKWSRIRTDTIVQDIMNKITAIITNPMAKEFLDWELSRIITVEPRHIITKEIINIKTVAHPEVHISSSDCAFSSGFG